MSEQVKVRLLLGRFHGDTEPSVFGCVDQTLWEHWDDDDAALWRKDCQEHSTLDPTDLEWREVWAVFAPQELVDAFKTPIVHGGVILDETQR